DAVDPFKPVHAPEPPAQLGCWLDEIQSIMKGAAATPDVPVDVTGTPFQHAVWDFLRTIPRGSTVSYQEVARGIARPNAVRAVAGACANNSVAILIPCHRVIRGNGDLAGYRWGLDRKRALLAMEGRSEGP
ncbi:MAG: methylated-DNA--[protein]-cysteine S-methyltransferase, partial [Chthoniobacterales bacterium]